MIGLKLEGLGTACLLAGRGSLSEGLFSRFEGLGTVCFYYCRKL